MFAKLADGEAASIPQIQVPSQPAADKNTLPGMVPPISFTRVNAGTPPTPDAGAQAQKSQVPMGAQMLPKTARAFSREDRNMNMTSRPLIQDLVKGAMANAASRAKIAYEGAHQLKLAEEKCEKCEKAPCACHDDKIASINAISTDFALKLASAIEYAVPILAKQAEGPAAAPPPGVTATTNSDELPGPGGYGQGRQQPPTSPAVQKASPKEQSPTQMANTMDSPQGGSGVQTTAMSGGQGKTAAAKLAQKNLAVLAKLAKKGEEKDISLLHAIPGAVMGLGGVPVVGSIQGGMHSMEGARLAADAGEKPAVGSMRSIVGQGLGGFGGAVLGGMAGAATGDPSVAMLASRLGGHGGAYVGHRVATNKYRKKEGSAPATLVNYFLARTKVAEDAAGVDYDTKAWGTKNELRGTLAGAGLGALAGGGLGALSGGARGAAIGALSGAGLGAGLGALGGRLSMDPEELARIDDARVRGRDAGLGLLHGRADLLHRIKNRPEEMSAEQAASEYGDDIALNHALLGRALGTLGGAGLGAAIGKNLEGVTLGGAAGMVGGYNLGKHIGKLRGESLINELKGEGKVASAPATLVDHFLQTVKQAEDAINPAQISAGEAIPPETSASGEAGGAPVAGMPQGPRGLVGSNESAMNYKRNQAYGGRKSELAQYFNEPALTQATDKTLNESFSHADESGHKLSSAQQTVKSAAARALLMKIAEEAEKKDDKKKQEDKKKQSIGVTC